LRKKWVAVFVGVAVLGTFAAVALGSGSLFFTSTPLVTANLDNKVQLNSDRVKFQTKDRQSCASQRSSSVRAAPAAGITTQAS